MQENTIKKCKECSMPLYDDEIKKKRNICNVCNTKELSDDDAIRAVVNTALYDAFQKGMEVERLRDNELWEKVRKMIKKEKKSTNNYDEKVGLNIALGLINKVRGDKK